MPDHAPDMERYRELGHELIDGLLDEHVRAVVEFARHLGRLEDQREIEGYERDLDLQGELDRSVEEVEAGGGVRLEDFLRGERSEAAEPVDV